jgi:hypothetical protein
MLSYSSRPPDPMLAGRGWREIWLKRLENMPFLAREWISRQTRDAYWKHGSVCEDYSAIEAAVLSIGGWHDGYRNTISHLVENIERRSKGSSGRGSTNTRIMPGRSRGSAFCRRQNAGGTAGSRASTMAPRTAGLPGLADGFDRARALVRRTAGPLDRREPSGPRQGLSKEHLLLGDGSLGGTPMSEPVAISSPVDCGSGGRRVLPLRLRAGVARRADSRMTANPRVSMVLRLRRRWILSARHG